MFSVPIKTFQLKTFLINVEIVFGKKITKNILAFLTALKIFESHDISL